jgi:AcrR family transcriptional regulator
MAGIHKARKPTQERGIQTMRRLMDAGRSLFAERGYHNVHAGDIAGVAGVAVGSFYAYFDDKHRLFLTLVDEFTEEVLNKESSVVHTVTEHPAEEISIEEIFNRLFNTSVEAHRHSAAFFREVLRMSLADPEVRSRLERIEMRARGALEAGLLKFRKGLSKKKSDGTCVYNILRL